MVSTDHFYLETFLDPIRVCRQYKPKFGLGSKESGLNLDRFLSLYAADPFYAWIGLNSGLMYAAHKAAGGMTSVYRQVGKGCENLFRQIVLDCTSYQDAATATWSYTTKTKTDKDKTLSLDARLEIAAIKNLDVKAKVIQWIRDYSEALNVPPAQNGSVFEVRQGYKSKDSKRQNADIDNIAVAWANGYLPVFAIFSSQIDGDLVLRYRNNRAGILVGTLSGTNQTSLFVFCQEILGYNLADFFCRHSAQIQQEVHATLEALLSTD